MIWLSKIKGYMIAAGAAAAVLIAAYLRARQDGRNSAALDQERKRIDAIRYKKETDDEVERMGDAAVDDELNRWLRDR